VDDSSSMVKSHRNDVVKAADLLSYICKTHDKNGIDLRFASEPRESTNCRTATNVITRVRAHFHKTLWFKDQNRLSKISPALNAILDSYKNRLSKYSSSSKPAQRKKLLVIVLTDGLWQPHAESATRDSIKNFIEATKYLHEDEVGIQFVRFGNSPDAKALLDRLDQKGDFGRDIVDHEAWFGGDVAKMLCGPTNKWYDNDVSILRDHAH
jgi:hypothetical protein